MTGADPRWRQQPVDLLEIVVEADGQKGIKGIAPKEGGRIPVAERYKIYYRVGRSLQTSLVRGLEAGIDPVLILEDFRWDKYHGLIKTKLKGAEP